MGAALSSRLAELVAHGSNVTVDISLRDDVALDNGSSHVEAGRSSLPEQGTTGLLNGKVAGPAEFAADTARIAQSLQVLSAKKQARRNEILSVLSALEGWNLPGAELKRLAGELGPVVRSLPAATIERLLRKHGDKIGAIELHSDGRDDTLVTAMAATSADPGALQLTDSHGTGVGVYLTEYGCPPSDFITNYTLIDGPDTTHSRNTTSILRAVSPEAWIYCRGGSVLPSSAELGGTGGNPRIHIVTRSQSSSFNAEYGTEDRDWDNFTYDTGVLVTKSAGNNGDTAHGGTGTIGSPGKGLNILTVGNYDDATNSIWVTSSFADPTNTRNRKPEISAPGTNIDAGGITATGTSQATPHVAGLLADEMQARPWLQLRPHLAKAHAIAAATDAISGGADLVGEGGLDYLSGHTLYREFAWSGGNDYFDTAADNDWAPGNGIIDVFVPFTAGQNVRVVLSWLTRGTYTYDHRADAHPIGTDLDLVVSSGSNSFSWVVSSSSWDNPYEIVNFTAPVTGTYRIAIHRYENRDTSARTAIGLNINE
jgi:hypothetical protein